MKQSTEIFAELPKTFFFLFHM